MQRISTVNAWGIIKANFHLAIRNNLFLAAAYLFAIPLFRGIANLDAVRSAECLEQSVILIGIILIVPLNAPEQLSVIQEVVSSKKFPQWAVLLLRLTMAVMTLIVMTGVFSGILIWKNCTFPFVAYVTGTVISAAALGSSGFFVSVLSHSVIAGYFVSVGYYLLNLLGNISNENNFYLFSMGTGNNTAKIWLLGLSVLAMAMALIYEKRNPL